VAWKTLLCGGRREEEEKRQQKQILRQILFSLPNTADGGKSNASVIWLVMTCFSYISKVKREREGNC
jgi:hypothetical protein